MQTNMIIRQTLRLGTTVQRMNPKRNATVFKRVYPPKRLPGKIFSTFSFSDSFTRTQYIDIFFVFQTMCCQSVTFVCLSIYFQFKSFDSFLLDTPENVNIEKWIHGNPQQMSVVRLRVEVSPSQLGVTLCGFL